MKEFPVRSPAKKMGGLVYFGRMLDKIRVHARGELPEDYQPNLGKGFDSKCCAFLHVDYDEVAERVKEGASDDEMLKWAFETGRGPTEKEIIMWNELMRKFGWRDAPLMGDLARRWVETYCYAFGEPDFLENEPQQLYWRTDIVQMTRYYMIEAARSGIRLSPRDAGFPV